MVIPYSMSTFILCVYSHFHQWYLGFGTIWIQYLFYLEQVL